MLLKKDLYEYLIRLVGEQENIRTQNFISTLENISEDSLDALISPRKQSQTKLPHPKYPKIIQPMKKIENLCQNIDKIESGVSFNYTQSQKTANIDASPCKESLIQFPDPTRQENFKSVQNNASIGNNEESQSLHTRSRSEFCQEYSYWSDVSTSNGSNTEQNYFKDVKNTHHKYQKSSHFPPKPNKIEINKFSISTPTSFFRPIQAPIPSLCGSPKCWVSKNVTKQYTSSFILQAMPEPYRTSIEFKKKRAREIRKSAYTFLA